MIDSNKPRRHEQFYGFRERPFMLQPDPGFLYMSEKHRTALDLLELAVINQSGFCVISGDVGVGKTTLVRELLNRLDDNICVGMVTNTRPSFSELLQLIMASFGLKFDAGDNTGLYTRFIEFTIRQYADNKHILLIIDEAQHLSVAALEELRMLSNINADKDILLQVILVGQEELHHKLVKPELAQFAQRIAVDYHLTGLQEQETGAYIRYRVDHAGGSPELFGADACSAVHHYSDGIPRLINRLCGLSLVYGYAEQSQVITPELVTAVARDQHIGSLEKIPGNMSKRGADAFTRVVKPKSGDEAGHTDKSHIAVPGAAPVPAASILDEIEITALEDVSSSQKKTVTGNSDATPGVAAGRKSPDPVAVATTVKGQADFPRDGVKAEAIRPGRQSAADIDPAVSPVAETLVAGNKRKRGTIGKRRGASWMLAALVVVAATVAVSSNYIRDYLDAMPAADSVAAKRSIQPPPIARRASKPERELRNTDAVVPVQREAERLAQQRRQAEQEQAEKEQAVQKLVEKAQAEKALAEQKLAEKELAAKEMAEKALAKQREVENLEQQRRQASQELAAQQQAEKELAQQREAERLAQQRRQAEQQQAEKARAKQREAERLAQQRRQAEQEQAEKARAKQREAERLAQQRRQAGQEQAGKALADKQQAKQREAERQVRELQRAQRELREMAALWEQQSRQLREESQLVETRREAAEARLKKWSKETGWSDDAE